MTEIEVGWLEENYPTGKLYYRPISDSKYKPKFTRIYYWMIPKSPKTKKERLAYRFDRTLNYNNVKGRVRVWYSELFNEKTLTDWNYKIP